MDVPAESETVNPEFVSKLLALRPSMLLILENFVILKQDQPNAKEIDVDAYRAEFALD